MYFKQHSLKVFFHENSLCYQKTRKITTEIKETESAIEITIMLATSVQLMTSQARLKKFASQLEV